jgi:hypothetical protein
VLVDLDTKDLIRLQGDSPPEFPTLQCLLKDRNARLVLSSLTIDEAVEPLRNAGKSSVTQLLNRIESLPHVWIRTVDLDLREIRQAALCYLQGREYEPVSPFVNSYVETLLDLPPEIAAHYGGRSLSEILWDQVYGEGKITRQTPSLASRFPSAITMEREVTANWTDREYETALKQNFSRYIQTHLTALGNELSGVKGDAFAEHLWGLPCWCPGLWVTFATRYVLVRDRQTAVVPSDVTDLSRLCSIPYVDVFTCDNSKRDYLRRLSTRPHFRLKECACWIRCKILSDLPRAIAHLTDNGASS